MYLKLFYWTRIPIEFPQSQNLASSEDKVQVYIETVEELVIIKINFLAG